MMKNKLYQPQSAAIAFSSAIALFWSLAGNPAFAGDFFRTQNQRDIGPQTEAAFEAVFVEGNYPKAEGYLKQALATEKDDPLVYAMQASLAYGNQDSSAIAPAAANTLAAAQRLLPSDPLRGNLYLAIGHFIEGASLIQTQGPIGALPKLQEVLKYLDEAEKIDANDPELNLFKGFMELMLAVNLPLASPEVAIANFQRNAAPEYLVNRGIAVAYRDQKKYDKGLEFVNKALQETPDNPELKYLKAQLLYQQGKKLNDRAIVQEAIALFDAAIAQQNQLPAYLRSPLQFERTVAQNWLDGKR
ncbi:Sll0314/Alr1548 family TPR repeat-containing protein [Oscillatoria sp. FACHB-1406]|uniref:Sll0314/Alr1548 family TPR repeat-containing protein n=1 Tax=Oscillatoria sp. FACHB-1406 TaxID=2692846 RepID=UPI001F55705C|nr:Sll0314/Alr1548 family TPR repeat-containing protein [Oscillatoria sp. FACHB-1406]